MRFYKKGGISILLAWLTVFLLVLALVLAEAGRSLAVRYQQTRAGNTAAQNMGAAYDRQLFEDYGLLFYDGGMGKEALQKAAIEAEFRSAFMENAGAGAAPFLASRDVNVTLTDSVSAVDYHGEILIREALEYFKYEGAAVLLDKIREQLDLFGKGEEERERIQSQDGALEDAVTGSGGILPQAYGPFAWDVADFPSGAAAFAWDTQAPAARFLFLDAEEAPSEDGESDAEDYDHEALEQAINESVIGDHERAEATGVMKLVLPPGKTLSGASFLKQGFPSREFGGEELESEGILKEALKKVVFDEYLLEHFPSFVDGGVRDGLSYELEYVLYGDPSDEVNLSTVVNRLMWMREGMNLLFLSTSEEKQAAAEELALKLAGWTGPAAEVLVPLVTVAILAAWAYGESLIDVRTLLSGDRVPILKTEGSWNSDLSGLADILKGRFTAGPDVSFGMSYRDYLRVLLFLGNGEKHAFYAMDMIQLNRQKTDPHFAMRSELYAMEFETSAGTGPLFTSLPLFGNLLHERGYVGKNDYSFTISY